jgi:hypothetical protein
VVPNYEIKLKNEIEKLETTVDFQGIGSSMLPTAYYAVDVKLISDQDSCIAEIIAKARIIAFVSIC